MPPKAQIHSAASKGDVRGIAQAIKNGENVDSFDLARQTALHWAARKGQVRAVTVLVASRADIEKKTKHGKTAFDLAKEHGEGAVMEFLETALATAAGRPPARAKPGSPKKSPSKNASSPTRPNRRLRTAPKPTIEGTNQMLEWAKELADQYIAEADVAHDKAQESREAAKNAKSKEQKQFDEINKMTALLKKMREGGDASAAAASPARRPPADPSSAPAPTASASATGDSPAAAAAGPTPSAVPPKAATNSLNSPRVAATVLSAEPSDRDFTQRKVQRTPKKSPSKGGPMGAMDAISHIEVAAQKKKEDAAKRKANSARLREASQRRVAAAAEKKERLAAEKKAAVERQRDATRLANERSKKARDKSRVRVAERKTPLNAVSLDGSLENTPGAKGKAPRSARSTPRSMVAAKPKVPKSAPAKVRPQGAQSAASTPTAKTSVAKAGVAKAKGIRKTKAHSVDSTRTPKAASSGKAGQSCKIPRGKLSPNRSRIPTPNRGESVEIGSLEAEYIQMMRGISGKPGFEGGSPSPAAPATPQNPVVAGAYSVAGAAAHPQEVAKVFKITKLTGQGLGVGIFSSKSASGVRVKKIVSGSPFEKAGVKEGYRFILIDGNPATTHDRVVDLLKGSGGSFEVEMGIPVIAPPTPAQAREKAAIMVQRSLDSFFKAVKSRSVTVRRVSHSSPLGVALFSVPEDKVVQIDRLVPGGPFALAGVKEKDAILKVNGTSVVGQTHTEVIHMLKASDATMVLEVAPMVTVNENLGKLAVEVEPPAEGDVAEAPTDSVHSAAKDNVVHYNIIRQDNSKLGVALMTLKDSTGITLHSITPDGPFGVAGVPEGHVITHVDGVDMKSHNDVVEALGNAGDEFTVSVTPMQLAEPRGASTPSAVSDDPLAGAELSLNKRAVTRIPNRGLGIALYSNKRVIGVRISQVNPGGPVALAGITVGEVIVQIDGASMLKAGHDEVVEAFRKAPKSFFVVTVDAFDFDRAHGTESTHKPSDTSPQKDDAKSTMFAFDDMRYNTNEPVKTRSGPKPMSQLYGDDGDGDDDMRAFNSLMAAQDDDRLASFSGLNNSVGFQAAKKAQEQAMALLSMTEQYDASFGESPLHRAAAGSGSDDAAVDAANALPEAAESPEITAAPSPSEAYDGDGDDSASTPEPATPDRPTTTINDILSNWQAEFSPPTKNHHTPAGTPTVRGRQTAMI